MTLEQIVEETRQWPPEKVGELVGRLTQDPRLSDPGVEEAWKQETRRRLAEIENAPLSPEYFADLALALQGTFLYGDTALCLLPRASAPEIVGEVADLLIRCEGLNRVLCGAVVHDDLILSVRTERNGEDAAALIRHTLEGIGFGGGHPHRAGGKIPGLGRGREVMELLQDELLSRWLAT